MCGSGGGGVNGFKKFSADIESMCLVLGALRRAHMVSAVLVVRSLILTNVLMCK